MHFYHHFDEKLNFDEKSIISMRSEKLVYSKLHHYFDKNRNFDELLKFRWEVKIERSILIGQRIRECHEIIRVAIVKRLNVLKRDFEDVLFELRTKIVSIKIRKSKNYSSLIFLSLNGDNISVIFRFKGTTVRLWWVGPIVRVHSSKWCKK